MLNRIEKKSAYLFFEWKHNGNVERGTVLFVLPREFYFSEPELSWEVKETGSSYVIEVTAKHFAKAVGFDTSEGDCIFSDNYFDLPAGESRTIEVKKVECEGISDSEDLRRQLMVRTLNDVMLRAAMAGK